MGEVQGRLFRGERLTISGSLSSLSTRAPVGYAITACRDATLLALANRFALDAFLNPKSNWNTKERVRMERHLQAQFHLACKDENLTAVEKLLSLRAPHGEINIHINREYAFRRACERKHPFIVVKLLSVQHSHGEIEPSLFADLSPDLVGLPDLKEAFKKHSFDEARRCLKPIVAVSTNSEVQISAQVILAEKGQHRLQSQAWNPGTKP